MSRLATTHLAAGYGLKASSFAPLDQRKETGLRRRRATG